MSLLIAQHAAPLGNNVIKIYHRRAREQLSCIGAAGVRWICAAEDADYPPSRGRSYFLLTLCLSIVNWTDLRFSALLARRLEIRNVDPRSEICHRYAQPRVIRSNQIRSDQIRSDVM